MVQPRHGADEGSGNRATGIGCLSIISCLGKAGGVSHRREDDMAEWDQEKLEAVVQQKHGAEKGNVNRATEIICKFFLDAVEAKQYGWCAPVNLEGAHVGKELVLHVPLQGPAI